MRAAKIPRVASNVVSEDWGDPNAYPLDASGTGVTFLLPQALINEDINNIGTIRVDLAAASALLGLLEQIYEGDATFPYDVPVPGGTTDYSQFILGAERAGVDGVTLALGEQEAIQVVRAGQQLGTKLKIGASLGSFSHSTVTDLEDFAGKWSSCGRSHRRRSTCRCTRRCATTSRRPARSSSSPRTSRRARCVRGSACTRC